MKKIERLNAIIFALKEHGRMSASTLADHFEVSERTIYRDIDALSQTKVPIISYEGLGGGYEIDPDYFMPSLRLTEDEILMLLMVLRAGECLRIPNLAADYQLLRGKVINALAEDEKSKAKDMLRHVNFYLARIIPEGYGQDILTAIMKAFMERCDVTLDYYHPRRDATDKRVVSPTELFFDEGGWYLTGFCHLRCAKRVFRLDRIKSITLLEVNNIHLDKPLEPDGATGRFVEKSYRMHMTQEFYRVIKDNDYMRDCEVIEGGEWLTLQIRTRFNDDLVRLVLQYPEHITLLGPPEVLEEVAGIVEDLNKKYLKP